jgi:hypothetical protein
VLVDETQMAKPQKYTDTLFVIRKMFLVGLRDLQSMSNPIEPCMFLIILNFKFMKAGYFDPKIKLLEQI